MKLFISADIEGTTGITLWDETDSSHARYPYFADQMTREVSAACEGARAAGATDILIKDSHGSACNLIPRGLPEYVRLYRGWGSDVLSMMAGIDETYDGAFFTGYHSGAGMDTNPLSHTMNTRNNYVKINGMIAPELMINALTASMFGVPTRLVTGDKGLCDWIKAINPNVETVAVNEGVGRGTISIHPDLAIKRIRAAAERAMQKPAKDMMFPMPDHFDVEICFREHAKAKNGLHFPGVEQVAPTVIQYHTKDYMDVLRMLDCTL